MERARSATISVSGDVNLSPELLAKYGLKAGDEVAIVETEAGLLVGSKDDLIDKLLDQVGAAMLDKGITLEVMMARSPEIRKELLKDHYDIDPEA
ncbi:MAG: hypothetical protein IT320_03645 [Anaerolineae bacterium]|nr:hypothetical protein [Anaerolineae bacterium]